MGLLIKKQNRTSGDFFMLAMPSGVCYTTAVWSRGQVVKTPPFHGGIMGSNPVGTTSKKDIPCECLFFIRPFQYLRTLATVWLVI